MPIVTDEQRRCSAPTLRPDETGRQRRCTATTLRWWGKVIVLIPPGGIVEDVAFNVFERLLVTDNEVVKAGLPGKRLGVYALNHSATSRFVAANDAGQRP